MTKTLKAPSGTQAVEASSAVTKAVRNAKSGQVVIVKGFGALKGSDFTIRKGVNLLKPIAAQALTKRSDKGPIR